VQKVPISLTSTTLEIWSHRLSRQCSTYMYILMYHWAATNTTGSYCLKNRQVYSKLHHLYATCSICSPSARSEISGVDELRWCIKNEWTVWITLFIECAVGDMAASSVQVLAFVLEADISSIWWKDDVTYCTFDVFGDNNCQSFWAIQWFIEMQI